MTDPTDERRGTDYDLRLIAALRACFAVPPEQRPALAEALSAADEELRVELVRALQSDAPGLPQALRPGEVLQILSEDARGLVLGSWRLEGQIDSGGMGRVYLARNSESGREAAVKLVLPGSMTTEGLARFVREAELMRRVSHPSVARILDADPRARVPWIAMEYVAGAKSITQHARGEGLCLEARLELIEQVARALEHVHSCGVVHRDIKPGNLLVGDDGVVKVIDFGIAWNFGPERRGGIDAQGETRLTRTGFVPGTRPYMSPEQLVGLKREVTSRSDVYSLAVVLYELATGRVPHDPDAPDFARRVRELRPIRPSRLADCSRSLDAVVLQALEKDPLRRYASAGDFADDLARVRHGLRVAARRPRPWPNLRPALERHRNLLVAVAGAVLMAGWATWSLVNASIAKEQDDASNKFAWGVVKAAIEANHGAVAEFVKGQLAENGDLFVANPELIRIVGQEVVEPLLTSGKYEDAQALLSRAQELTDGVLDPEDPVQVELRSIMGILQFRLGHFAEAETLFTQVCSWHERTHDGEQVDCLRSLSWLALTLFELGRIDECGPMIERVLELRRELLGDDAKETLQALACLGRLRRVQGRQEEAEAAYLDVLDLYRSLGQQDCYEACVVENNLSHLYQDQKRLESAFEHGQRALEAMRQLHPPEHPEVLLVRNLVATIRLQLGDEAWAEAELSDILAIQRRTLGPDNGHTLRTMINLAVTRHQMGRSDGVLELLEQAAAGLEAAEGATSMTATAARAELNKIRAGQ